MSNPGPPGPALLTVDFSDQSTEQNTPDPGNEK